MPSFAQSILHFFFHEQLQRCRLGLELAALYADNVDYANARQYLNANKRSLPSLLFSDRSGLYSLGEAFVLRSLNQEEGANSSVRELLGKQNLSPGTAALLDVFRGNSTRATELWNQQLADTMPSFPWALAGCVALLAKDYQKAIDAFEQAWAKGDKSVLFLKYLACRKGCEFRTQVVQAGQEALEHETKARRRVFLLLDLLLQHSLLQEFEQADVIVQELQKHSPSTPIPALGRHSSLIVMRRAGESQKAAEALEEWLGDMLKRGRWLDAWLLLQQDGQFSRALDILEGQKDDGNEALQYCFGVTLLKLGRPKSALSYCQSFYDKPPLIIADYIPGNSKSLLRSCYEQLHQIEEARSLLNDPAFLPSARADFELFWNGRQTEAELSQSTTALLYRGEFEQYFSRIAEGALNVEGWPHVNARVVSNSAGALHWANEYQAASKLYDKAAALYGPDAYAADKCRLQSLECRALAEQNVRAEWDKLRPRLEAEYPEDKQFLSEVAQTDFVVLLREQRYEEAKSRIEEYLHSQPSHFFRALALWERISAHEALRDRESTRADIAEIKRLAPGSYFDRQAEALSAGWE